MAGIRPAKCYRWDSPAYTRVNNNPSDSYITGIPASKLNTFNMGNVKGEFDTEASIVYSVNIQVRHNALDAARVQAQKTLEKSVGLANYFFKVRPYPHHVMRENVQASGAGADRVSDGMRHAFGKPIGRAARINRGQKLFSVYFNNNEQRLAIVKKALHQAEKKLPGYTSVLVEPVKAKK
ncbi:MAG: 50S ribosomal protein L16 [Candidatus Altiarchaeota archaeon]|nr:50S ribosomal protein L16 [Candidatus Altiarchaeota archaeon]